MYGIDWDGPVPSETWGSLTDSDDVVVPELSTAISESQLAQLQQNINPLGQTLNYGIDIYENTLEFVQNVLTIQQL